MKLSDTLIKEIEQEIVDGFISKRKHDNANIYILNYTPKTMQDWRWNSATELCRGLIVDSEYNVVARSYYKFFSIDQLDDLSVIPTDEECEVYDKVDGFLGIMYFIDNIPYVSSRGSFHSEMADAANEMLRTKYSHIKFDPKYSYVFEIICPNDILTYNYGDEKKLILHGIFDNETGDEIPLADFDDLEYLEDEGIEIIEQYEVSDKFNGFEYLISKYPFADKKEGFVVRFKSGFRLKLKYDEYKTLCHIKNMITPEKLLEMIINDESLKDCWDSIPEANKREIEAFTVKVTDKYENIYSSALSLFKQYYVDNKAAFAKSIIDLKEKHLLFALYSGNYSKLEKYIWDNIKDEFNGSEE